MGAIYVPQTILKEAKTFQALEERGVEKALRLVQDPAYRKERDPTTTDTTVYRAVFMPELVDTRNLAADRKEHDVWNNWYATPSIKLTGKSRGGNAVAAYVHGSNPFSTYAGITAAVDAGLVNGAGIIDRDSFLTLLDRAGDGLVFVVDYNPHSPSGVMSISDSLKLPRTAAFLGGKDRAERYHTNHQKVYGTDRISNRDSKDLDQEQTRARVLFLGDSYYYYDYDLGGVGDLNGVGRFLGVAPEARAAQPADLGEIVQAGISEDAIRRLLTRDLITP